MQNGQSLYFIKPSEWLIRQPLQDTFIQVQLTLEAEPKLVISLLTSLSQARCWRLPFIRYTGRSVTGGHLCLATEMEKCISEGPSMSLQLEERKNVSD